MFGCKKKWVLFWTILGLNIIQVRYFWFSKRIFKDIFNVFLEFFFGFSLGMVCLRMCSRLRLQLMLMLIACFKALSPRPLIKWFFWSDELWRFWIFSYEKWQKFSKASFVEFFGVRTLCSQLGNDCMVALEIVLTRWEEMEWEM